MIFAAEIILAKTSMEIEAISEGWQNVFLVERSSCLHRYSIYVN